MASTSVAERFKDLVSKAKALTKKGQHEASLAVYRQALAVHHHDKVVERIKKIEVLQSVTINILFCNVICIAGHLFLFSLGHLVT